jgi:chemotaxis response regulator CheB
MSTAKKTRVLIVDDSALVRRAISDALSRDPEIEVVGNGDGSVRGAGQDP